MTKKKSAAKSRPAAPHSPLQTALLVGSIFPVGATLLDIFIQGLPPGLDSIITVQTTQPLHWIIDLVPIAMVFMTLQKKGEKPTPPPKINAQVEQRATERAAKLSRTVEELKAALADQKTIEQQLREAEEQARSELETVQAELDMIKRTSPTALPTSQSADVEAEVAFASQTDDTLTFEEPAPLQGRQYHDDGDADGEYELDEEVALAQETQASSQEETRFSVSESGLLRVPGLSPDGGDAPAASPDLSSTPAAVSAPEPFDLSEALARVDGDQELLSEMAELFLEESPRFVSEIHTALEKNDTQTLTYAAHTLKGSVGNFAANDAAEAARKLEQMGRKGELAGAGVILAELEAALDRLKPALEALNTLEAA